MATTDDAVILAQFVAVGRRDRPPVPVQKRQRRCADLIDKCQKPRSGTRIIRSFKRRDQLRVAGQK